MSAEWTGLRVALACVCALAAATGAAQPTALRDNPNAPGVLERPPFLPGTTAAEGFQLPQLPLPEGQSPESKPRGEVLRTLVIRGNAAIATEALMEVARLWLDQPVDPADLEALRVAMTRHYVDQGYVNSGVRLDADGLRNGVLGLEVVEGRLTSLRFSGLDGLDERYLASRLWPDADAPLQLNALRERYQLLLDDPLIRRMNARLQPDVGPGTAALDVEVERAAPWSFSVRLNNHRPASVGERAVTVDAGYRNLTGRGDALRLTVQPDGDMRRLTRLGVGWSIPLVYPGTHLTLQLDDGESTVVEEPLASADVRSRIVSHEVGLGHVLWESLQHRIALGVTWISRRNETSIGGSRFPFVVGVPDEGLRSRSLRLWQEYTYRSQNAVLALRSTFTWTHNNLLPVAGAASRSASFWLGQGQYAQRLGDTGLQAVTRATVQQTSHHLPGIDGFSIGGAGSVRGWRENQLIRDRGAFLNLELEIPVLQSNATDTSLHLLPFVDYGRGRNVGQGSDAIGSVGLALRWRSGPWAAEAAWGRRVLSTVGKARAGHTLQDYGLHFQLSYAMGR